MPGKMKHLQVPNGRLVLAVSDGELNNGNLDGRGSDQSLNSLPSVQTAGFASDRSVASWAVSFERLLQDPAGIEYFTEFLKKEYSAENICFWKSCEKFQAIPEDDTEQLLKESRWIYNEYLSSSSLCPINVDQQALITEEMLQKPTPHLFKPQQQQIFNLMKFDSYARFVKSPLYQDCMVSEVEGRPLPAISSSPTSLIPGCSSFNSGAIKKKNLRAGKSLPIGVEASGTDVFNVPRQRRSFKKKDRGTNVKEVFDNHEVLTRQESDGSLNSATSLDLSNISSLSGKSENDNGSTNSMERETEWKHIKYCCVYLPDGTASLTAVRPGLTIREMLTGVCEKRGYSPSDVKVYLAGNNQKALALDQDCMVLTDQEVRLENRISFELQVETLNKNLRIVAKPTKTIQEALHSILKKYGLDNQQFILKKVGQSKAVDQGNSVSQVAGLTLLLQTVTDVKEHIKAGGNTAEAQVKNEAVTKEKSGPIGMPRADHQHHTKRESNLSRPTQVKNKPYPHKNEIEGLVEMLNRVQSSRTDNQRGLLSKEDLVLPDFLKLPTDEMCDECHKSSLDNPSTSEGVESGDEQNFAKDNRSPSPETVCLSQIESANAFLSEIRSNIDMAPTVTVFIEPPVESTVSNDNTCTENNSDVF
ncbi:regulator of G-protein signaling 14 isoform X2 [Hyperolius riggenbachi]|uniref:regulator of G-protein signaling 14 isoform X2 n=1 Tax=Hyperolius riggenbachi TaxID=752182 RepID=UPI0035A357B7